MENEVYLVVNGEKRELTQEQLRSLGVTLRKNPFKRVDEGEVYYCINLSGNVYMHYDNRHVLDEGLYDVSNYFNDKAFANQVALHQLLYRKLLKFAYENDCEDREWGTKYEHWRIYYDIASDKFDIDVNDAFKYQGVYFSTSRAAKRAIEEVVKPFVKEHPEFVW